MERSVSPEKPMTENGNTAKFVGCPQNQSNQVRDHAKCPQPGLEIKNGLPDCLFMQFGFNSWSEATACRRKARGLQATTIMELYFKDLISEEASLERLVDDLALVVHGADDFARAVGVNLPEQSRKEIATRLDRLKKSYRRLSDHATAGARATDKLLREQPYLFLGGALVLGLLIGSKLGGKK
jgi:ElaB/YqjD/DUF883 family membrane-anchored ribosome-binding protein